jgi:hypothetical protein
MKSNIYRIAEIAYEDGSDSPWYIRRTGVVTSQGGMEFGTEAVRFKTLEGAMCYLEGMISRDLGEVKKRITEKDEWNADN